MRSNLCLSAWLQGVQQPPRPATQAFEKAQDEQDLSGASAPSLLILQRVSGLDKGLEGKGVFSTWEVSIKPT